MVDPEIYKIVLEKADRRKPLLLLAPLPLLIAQWSLAAGVLGLVLCLVVGCVAWRAMAPTANLGLDLNPAERTMELWVIDRGGNRSSRQVVIESSDCIKTSFRTIRPRSDKRKVHIYVLNLDGQEQMEIFSSRVAGEVKSLGEEIGGVMDIEFFDYL